MTLLSNRKLWPLAPISCNLYRLGAANCDLVMSFSIPQPPNWSTILTFFKAFRVSGVSKTNIESVSKYVMFSYPNSKAVSMSLTRVYAGMHDPIGKYVYLASCDGFSASCLMLVITPSRRITFSNSSVWPCSNSFP